MSKLNEQLKQVSAAMDELRTVGDGPARRELIDSLFRTVHNLKAAASADGFNDLSHAAHELETVLHSLRTGKSSLDGNVLQQLTTLADSLPTDAIPNDIWSSLKAEEKHSLRQSVKEGANLFLVQTSFDVSNFDHQFQKLKETLSSKGEVISTTPTLEREKINFRILYARVEESRQILRELAGIPGLAVEELLSQKISSLSAVFQRAVRAGQSAAAAVGKEIDFEVRGGDVPLQKSFCDAVADPLLHLVRNAVDHGIEASEERIRLGKPPLGKIVIEASLDDPIKITITDDGRGIDPAVIPLIFRPGFSTAAEVTAISGRGVGLDAVETAVKEIGGSVTVNSEPGKGSSFEITVPDRR